LIGTSLLIWSDHPTGINLLESKVLALKATLQPSDDEAQGLVDKQTMAL
jgi:hypothetical protein